jgi:hypothetical protein
MGVLAHKFKVAPVLFRDVLKFLQQDGGVSRYRTERGPKIVGD